MEQPQQQLIANRQLSWGEIGGLGEAAGVVLGVEECVVKIGVEKSELSDGKVSGGEEFALVAEELLVECGGEADGERRRGRREPARQQG